MKIKNNKNNRDESFVILKKERYGAHWIFKNMDGWFSFGGKSGIRPNWSGNKPYNPEGCFFFESINDAKIALKLVIKNLEYKEHAESIEIVKWKDVPSYNIMDYLDNHPIYGEKNKL